MNKVRTRIGALLVVCVIIVLARTAACLDLSDSGASAAVATASSNLASPVSMPSGGAEALQVCNGATYGQACPVDFEKQVVTLINLVRADSGKGALVIDNRLFLSAHCHSEDMYVHACFQHDDCDGATWVARITSFGYSLPFSEVLCSGCTTPAGAVSLWMSSPTHRQILLDATFRHIGVGFVHNYWTVTVGGGPGDEIVPCLCCVGTTGNINNSGGVDLADLSALVSYLTGGGYVLTCIPEANVNGSGAVDLADLSALVVYLTGGGYTLPSCP
jgi:uncharacterized protein YkwD